MIETYKTIASPVTGEYKEKGSRFIAYAYPVKSEDECQQLIEHIRKEEHKARHHCYAYRVDVEEEIFRANDDGEPSGTAGRPILGQIDSFELFNVMVVVVRYFGGTKLGAGGLIQAYKIATESALSKAKIIRSFVSDIFELHFDYAHMGQIMDLLKSLTLEIMEQDFDRKAKVVIKVPKKAGDRWKTLLKARIAEVTEEEAETIEDVEGISWNWLAIG